MCFFIVACLKSVYFCSINKQMCLCIYLLKALKQHLGEELKKGRSECRNKCRYKRAEDFYDNLQYATGYSQRYGGNHGRFPAAVRASAGEAETGRKNTSC